MVTQSGGGVRDEQPVQPETVGILADVPERSDVARSVELLRSQERDVRHHQIDLPPPARGQRSEDRSLGHPHPAPTSPAVDQRPPQRGGGHVGRQDRRMRPPRGERDRDGAGSAAHVHDSAGSIVQDGQTFDGETFALGTWEEHPRADQDGAVAEPAHRDLRQPSQEPRHPAAASRGFGRARPVVHVDEPDTGRLALRR